MDSYFWLESLSWERRGRRARRVWLRRFAILLAVVFVVGVSMTGCGGGGGGGGGASGTSGPADVSLEPVPTTLVDATRLADQASFGATEALQADIMANGAARWVALQFGTDTSRYSRGGTDGIHRHTGDDFCVDSAIGDQCWRDYFSSQPLNWDFYRNALNNPDQLRQRVALALSQILVTSELEVSGTYGLREYQNIFLANAFGNYRTVLEKVALSPLMGDYLNNANNNKTDPNENFARELLQLFSVGTCLLESDGRLKGGRCDPVYDNARVRDYAYALTGWTYPAGGASKWGCGGGGRNCRYYIGDMVPRANAHDDKARTLLGGVSLPPSRTAPVALAAVLDSLMNHPNMGPFVGKQLTQHLTTSNPSPAYVARVAEAFNSGRYGPFGSGSRGDMQATIAAILLDAEARAENPPSTFGRLREPAQVFTGTLRALNGISDGDAFTWWWGENLRQHLFRSPSVFNFYPPDYPVAGTPLQGPQFAILNANTGLSRINYVNWLVYTTNGASPSSSIPGALGTKADLKPFEADAADPARLVDRMVRLGLGGRISPQSRQAIIDAVAAYDERTARTTYLRDRVRTAAYLVFASPHYHVAR
jgi:uncharacterized protein (DUF1800 family)